MKPLCPNELIFIFGNPPFLGYILESLSQKASREFAMKSIKEYKKLILPVDGLLSLHQHRKQSQIFMRH